VEGKLSFSRGAGRESERLAVFAGYQPVVREPIAIEYRGRTILTPPLPSSGGIVLAEMLHMLEPHDVGALGASSSAYIHLMAEVMKRAYADRAAFLGDSDQIDVPVDGLLSRSYALDLMKSFDPERATPAPGAGPGDPAPFEHPSTTHFSIVDAAGNVVANTYTLNGSYGTGAVVEGWGFLLNNEMDDFSVRPGVPNMYGLVGGEANAVAPGKRMLSSMTPTIVLQEGKPVLVLGTPGGSRIITMVLQVLTGVIDFDMELQQAVDHPRCHNQWLPDKLWCEKGYPSADVAENLKRRGHNLVESGEWGEVDAIQIDPATGERRGAADARGYGEAVGY